MTLDVNDRYILKIKVKQWTKHKVGTRSWKWTVLNTIYDFDTAWQLLEDFWNAVDEVLLEEGIE